MTTTAEKIDALVAGIASLDRKMDYIRDEYLGNAWRSTMIKQIQNHIDILKEMKAELEAKE